MEYELGIKYLKEENEDKAFEIFQSGAQKGQLDCIHYLAHCYENEIGIEEDFNKAINLYKQAASLGYVPSQIRLVEMYGLGHLYLGQDRHLRLWYQEALNKEDEDYFMLIAKMHWFGVGASHDKIEAVKWFKKAAFKGNKEAMEFLYHCYNYGTGVAQDDKKAAYWLHLIEK